MEGRVQRDAGHLGYRPCSSRHQWHSLVLQRSAELCDDVRVHVVVKSRVPNMWNAVPAQVDACGASVGINPDGAFTWNRKSMLKFERRGKHRGRWTKIGNRSLFVSAPCVGGHPETTTATGHPTGRPHRVHTSGGDR